MKIESHLHWLLEPEYALEGQSADLKMSSKTPSIGRGKFGISFEIAWFLNVGK